MGTRRERGHEDETDECTQGQDSKKGGCGVPQEGGCGWPIMWPVVHLYRRSMDGNFMLFGSGPWLLLALEVEPVVERGDVLGAASRVSVHLGFTAMSPSLSMLFPYFRRRPQTSESVPAPPKPFPDCRSLRRSRQTADAADVSSTTVRISAGWSPHASGILIMAWWTAWRELRISQDSWRTHVRYFPFIYNT
ncbi:hypothetical protein FIBSPDRAFT_903074 [Athelia psychrophila]|uniref:Uncharacterized protein n=1 Tax=Athelia psychrophila TaxID=1759441 RepID=A0A167WFQ1_9AGAM|nr:hypothetical protein FIBSPDRAFT_903074 [Fibularhizoctonia sp. CBS 109695]